MFRRQRELDVSRAGGDQVEPDGRALLPKLRAAQGAPEPQANRLQPGIPMAPLEVPPKPVWIEAGRMAAAADRLYRLMPSPSLQQVGGHREAISSPAAHFTRPSRSGRQMLARRSRGGCRGSRAPAPLLHPRAGKRLVQLCRRAPTPAPLGLLQLSGMGRFVPCRLENI